MKSVSLFFAVFAVLSLLGGVVQINPVWLYGPYSPSVVSTAAQPDWYVGWMEGALRLFPPWELRIGHFMIPNPFFPAVLLPGLTFLGLYAWPFVERKLTKDYAKHELLDRPRFHPWRTAIGVATLTFYFVLFVAGSQDVIASQFDVSVNAITVVLRALLFVLPVISGAIAFAWCRGLGEGTATG
jgi:ubiquinol-cytochrome c reductase cytochrome b subunit